MKPTISVVIPTFNQAEYLAEAIESVLAQTFQKWDYLHEIIIVVDGSQDNSLNIAHKYEGQTNGTWVKVISQVNKGLSSARNTGIMNATGSYVFFLDSDDILLSNCLDKVAEIIEETRADIIAPSFKCFGVGNDEVILMPDPKLEDFRVGNRIAYCQAIKRDVLLEVGGYSPRMKAGYEDLHLTINLLTLGKKLVTIPEVLWLYRTKEKSMIHDAMKHHEELLAQINKDFPLADIKY